VLVVGQIKLSEICNIDQSLLLFKYLKSCIYVKKGDRTVCLKERKSSYDRCQCTLQIAVFADRVIQHKPLLIFKDKPKEDSCQKTEQKRYHSSIVVIFNKKV
jgi:hypothetical protein